MFQLHHDDVLPLYRQAHTTRHRRGGQHGQAKLMGRQGHGRRRRKRSWPRPQLVCGLPARPVDGRIPARQRLGRRGRVFAPNAHGWWEIFPQHEAKPATASAEPCRDAKHPLQTQKVPAELHGKCFNCLSYSHRVATCRLPRRCLRCHGFAHLARDCRWTRHVVASATTGGDRPWHPARGSNPSASQHAPRAVGAASSAASAGAEFSQT